MLEQEFDRAPVADDAATGVDEAVARPARRSVLRPAVARALDAPVGPDLLVALVAVMALELSAREWLEVTVGWKRMASYVAGAQLAAVAALDAAVTADPRAATRRRGAVPSTRATADELAPALGIAPQAASRLVALARRAEAELPAAADALGEGRMDPTQLRVLASVTRGMPAAAARRVEALAVRVAHRCTARQLEARLEAEAARADPGFTARQAGRAREERDVVLRRSPLPGGRQLVADLPLVEAVQVWQALDAMATAAKDRGVRPDGTPEDRTLPQLRSDALVGALTGLGCLPGPGQGGDGLVPTRERLAALAEVQVVVAAQTLTGQSELPATIPGHGPLDAAEARRVAALAPWRRLVADDATGTLLDHDEHTHPAPQAPRPDPGPEPGRADPTAEPPSPASAGPAALRGDPRWQRMLTDPLPATALDHGTSRYVPPAPLRRHVHTRDATCIGPACEHTARGTQLDHTVDYGRTGPDGTAGTTRAGNLGSGCRRVHNAKTHGGWQLRQPASGTFTWTSPLGRLYHRTVAPLVPGWLTLQALRAGRPPVSGGPRTPDAGPAP